MKDLCIFDAGIPPPPDAKFSMFVDPAGWSQVETKPKSEWTRVERYEYALKKELHDANKGIRFY